MLKKCLGVHIKQDMLTEGGRRSRGRGRDGERKIKKARLEYEEMRYMSANLWRACAIMLF